MSDTRSSDSTLRAAWRRIAWRQRLATLCGKPGLLPVLASLRRMLGRDLRILAYHRVRDVDPDTFDFDLNLISASSAQFREQMQLVRKYFDPVSFRDVVSALDGGPALPAKPLVVTFDDGYDDNYAVAFPILREQGVPATFFVSTGHIDSGAPYEYDWLVHMFCRAGAGARLHVPELGIDEVLPDQIDERRRMAGELLFGLKGLDAAVQTAVIARLEVDWGLPRPATHPDSRPMTWDQLREMHAAGMEIGSHGVAHRILAKLSKEEMAAEVRESKRVLDRELGVPALSLSYPVGGLDAYDDEVIATARDAGFRVACNYIAGTNRWPSSPSHALHRLSVEREMDMGWFAAMTLLPEVFAYRKRLRTA